MIGLIVGIINFEYHANEIYYGKEKVHKEAMKDNKFQSQFNKISVYIIFISTLLAIIARTMKFFY